MYLSDETPSTAFLERDGGMFGQPEARRPPRLALTAGVLAIALVLAVAATVAVVAIDRKRADFAETLSARLHSQAEGRAQVVATWLEGVIDTGRRVAASELFGIFAAEMAAAGDGGAADPGVMEQRPYLERLLTDFAKGAGFTQVIVATGGNRVLVASAGAGGLRPEMTALADAAMKTGKPAVGTFRMEGASLVVDVALPVFPAQALPGEPAVAAAVLTVPAAERAGAFVRPPPLAQPTEAMRLAQRSAAGLEVVVPGAAELLRPAAGGVAPRADGVVPFDQRPSMVDGGTRVFSAAMPVPGTPWLAVAEVDAAAATAELDRYVTGAVALAGLVTALVALAFGAVWWRMASDRNKALAEQYRAFSAEIYRQKALLDSINDTITEGIGLKDLAGRYVYVNPAFAAMVGREAERTVNEDDETLFGFGTAQRLKRSDQATLDERKTQSVIEEIFLQGRQHHLRISKTPYLDQNGAAIGLVAVYHDITELVEAQRRRERVMRQITNALVRAVELRDPYLAGHSRRVAALAVAIGEELGVAQDVLTTLEAAASLSQIGKLGIPRALLTKAERLSEEEQRIIQGHLDHALTILREIEFDLPVADTVYEMNERLDGSGYPRGLHGEEISLAARILGTCDVFCARLEPRSYRGPISPDLAYSVLKDNRTRYDEKIIEALGRVLQSAKGAALLKSLGVDD